MDLSNYAIKIFVKGPWSIDTSILTYKKNDLVSLKIKIGSLDGDELKTVPVDLSNLSNVVNNDFVKKTLYNKLIIKFMLLILGYHALVG